VDYSITLKKRDWQGMWHEYEAGELHRVFRWEVLRLSSPQKDLDVSERILLKGAGLV